MLRVVLEEHCENSVLKNKEMVGDAAYYRAIIGGAVCPNTCIQNVRCYKESTR